MALTALQRRICRLLAENRRANPESYAAGAAALNELISGARISDDVDIFHDTEHAVAASWDRDRATLEAHGFHVVELRERPSYVEAEVRGDGGSVRIEWARDSAFRFFPLVEHEDFGFVLHPFDLATNKVLALVGRLEVRDWIDVIACSERLQPVGYLAWAASGKDPGFGPGAILEHAARSTHYSADEVNTLAFNGPPPDLVTLSRTWRQMLDSARELVALLPPEQVGRCVMTLAGALFTGDPDAARHAIASGDMVFHRGTIRSALPRLIP